MRVSAAQIANLVRTWLREQRRRIPWSGYSGGGYLDAAAAADPGPGPGGGGGGGVPVDGGTPDFPGSGGGDSFGPNTPNPPDGPWQQQWGDIDYRPRIDEDGPGTGSGGGSAPPRYNAPPIRVGPGVTLPRAARAAGGAGGGTRRPPQSQGEPGGNPRRPTADTSESGGGGSGGGGGGGGVPATAAPGAASFGAVNAQAAQYAAAISTLDNPRLGGGSGERESTSAALFYAEPVTDTFENEVLETYWYQARGTWSEAGGALDIVTIDPALLPGAILQYVGRESFDDVLVTADTPTLPTNRIMGLVARGQFKSTLFSGYFLWWQLGGTVLRLERYDDDVATSLGTFVIAPPFTTMELRCVGATIDAIVDDVVRISVLDATYPSGFCAIASGAAVAVPMTRIRITPG